ncbi:MAG: adenosylcobinamide amidohydrolase [bacterium]|nr:adenosylcobinamide amidohydrolase [bacterium]
MTVPVEPVLRVADAAPRGVLVWRWPATVGAISSAAVGGGSSRPGWVINVGVDSGYGRTDLAGHAAEVAAGLDLPGRGVALFTAASVNRPARSAAGGVTVHATVGVSHPTWAAAPEAGDGSAEVLIPEGSRPDPGPAVPPTPGTINLVIQVPVSLAGGAAVNAVITATEAKTQALVEAGVDGTGTATDAVVVAWPSSTGHSEHFAGPRSPWGERIARCVHAAVREGLAT